MLENDDSRDAIAARLERVRNIVGLGKKEFAERAGISEQAYGAYENARRDLSLQSAKKIRKTYRLSLEFLFFGIPDDIPTKISKNL